MGFREESMETKRFNLKQLLDHFSDIGDQRWEQVQGKGVLTLQV